MISCNSIINRTNSFQAQAYIGAALQENNVSPYNIDFNTLIISASVGYRTLAKSNINIQTIFEEYYTKWEEETKYLSSSKMFDNIYYRKIISLGIDVVPVIINKLKETPNHLFVALQKITGINPIKPENRGKIKEMANDWIDWWKQNENAEP
jgi:hypothetical protein